VYAGPFRLLADANGGWTLVEQVPLVATVTLVLVTAEQVALAQNPKKTKQPKNSSVLWKRAKNYLLNFLGKYFVD
jgi:hypothetical protein